MYPYLFQNGHFALPTFGVLAALGLLLGLELSERTASSAGIAPTALWDAGVFAALAAFCFSRLLLLAGNFRSFRAFPLLLLAAPSLTATGLLLTLIATLLWLRYRRIPVLAALDAWAPCATLLWAALALGHFAEGSDPGMPTTLPIGVRMPGAATPQYAVALYVAAAALALTAASFFRLQHRVASGEVAGFALAAAGMAQFLLSFLRQPGLATLWGLDALEWVACGMIVSGGTLLAASTKGNPSRVAEDQPSAEVERT